MKNVIRSAGRVALIVGVTVAPMLAFASDVQPFSTSDATSSINSTYTSIQAVLSYGLPGLLAGGVGMLLLGFFWRHGKRLITGRKF